MNTGTSLDKLASIRLQLNCLSEDIANVGSHDNIVLILTDLEKKFKACHDECHETFKKLGKEKAENEQQISELKEDIQKLKEREGKLMQGRLANDTSKFVLSCLVKSLCLFLYTQVIIQLKTRLPMVSNVS